MAEFLGVHILNSMVPCRNLRYKDYDCQTLEVAMLLRTKIFSLYYTYKFTRLRYQIDVQFFLRATRLLQVERKISSLVMALTSKLNHILTHFPE